MFLKFLYNFDLNILAKLIKLLKLFNNSAETSNWNCCNLILFNDYQIIWNLFTINE